MKETQVLEINIRHSSHYFLGDFSRSESEQIVWPSANEVTYITLTWLWSFLTFHDSVI